MRGSGGRGGGGEWSKNPSNSESEWVYCSHLCPSLSVDGLVGVDIRKSISYGFPSFATSVSCLRHPTYHSVIPHSLDPSTQ